jgi:hypothetical protein
MYDDPSQPPPKPKRRWGLVAMSLLLASGLVVFGFSLRPEGPPEFGFLKGATLVKIDRGVDPISGFGGVAHAYQVHGTFNEVVQRVNEELKARGGWQPNTSDRGVGQKIVVDPKAKPPSTGYYQLFLSKDSGVEVVEQEPANWDFGDRQTMWSPGGVNRPNVVTVFCTRLDTTMSWWAKVKAKLERLLP